MLGKLLPVLTGVAVLSACRVTEIKRPIAATADMRIGAPTRAWEILDEASDVAGLLVFFEALGAAEDSLYIVRNVWHQDLGLVDAYGRAFRYLPHHREPAWVGSGTVLQGVERILAKEKCKLLEMPFQEPQRPRSPGEVERVPGNELRAARNTLSGGESWP